VSDFDPDSLILVGRCGRPHGVRGDVKVYPETDDPESLRSLERLFIGASPAEARAYRVSNVRYRPIGGGVELLVKLDGFDSREAADAVKGHAVYLPEEELPPVEGEAHFLHDLVGLAVYEEGRDEPVGTVRDVLRGVAQDLLVVAREGRPDALVPDVDEFVSEVDLEAGRITITPPEGLLD
jgi:16S rRNA processing protein RimM